MLVKYIIFLSLLILSISSQAAPTCSKNGTTIIYTNGVTTKKKEARRAMMKIDDLALDSQIDLKMMNDSVLAYNYEESMSQDFLEAAVQRFPAGFLRSLGVKNGYAAYMGYLNGGLSDAIYAVALNSITDKLVEIQSNWLINYRRGPLYLKTIQEIKGHYEDALNRGERVFAISHSQGGLFMSDAFDQTAFSDKQKFFSGFQIASPLRDEMNSHFGYATHDKDNLINFVRATVGALPANVASPIFLSNGYTGLKDYIIDYHLNHGIVTTYLYDSTIRSQLITKLVETAQLLESNCPKAVINYTKNNLVVNFDSTDPQNPSLTGLVYDWDFGDGQISAEKSPVHTYSQAGTYNISLTVTDLYGTSDTVSDSVVVSSGATFNFTPDYARSSIKSLTLIDDLNHAQVDPMFSITSVGTISAPVGASITFFKNGPVAEIDCGSWVKTSTPNSIPYNSNSLMTCTRDANSPESTSITYRDAFMYWEGSSRPVVISAYLEIPQTGSAFSWVYYPVIPRYDMIERVGELHFNWSDIPAVFLF